jgi:E3 UFM1-protein ligase 1
MTSKTDEKVGGRASTLDHSGDNKDILDNPNTNNDLTIESSKQNEFNDVKNSISTDGLNGMMKLLFQRGYFQKRSHEEGMHQEGFRSIPTVLYQDKEEFVQPKFISCSSSANAESCDGASILPDSFCNDQSALVPLINAKDNLNNNCETYATVEVLVERFRQLINGSELRWTISDISTILRISIYTTIHNIIPKVLTSLSNSDNVKISNLPPMIVLHDSHCYPSIKSISQSASISSANDNFDSFLSILNGQSQIMTDQYFKMAFDFLREEIVDSKKRPGCISLSYVCDNVYKLPKTVVLSVLKVQFDEQHKNRSDGADDNTLLQLKKTEKGNRMVMSNSYWEEFRRKVVAVFETIVDTEVSLSKIAYDNSWDCLWVNEIVRQACDSNQLLATVTIRSDENFYRPKQYDQSQRKQLWDYYNLKGYVTSNYAKQCLSISSTNHMNEFMQQQFEVARQKDNSISAPIVINETIFHPITLLEPLHISIQDAVSTSSWTDLKQIIPTELLEHRRDDLHTLITQHIFTKQCQRNDDVDLSGGVLCIERTEAVYFSNSMITSFAKNRIPVIGESYARTKASQIMELNPQNESNTPDLENDIDDMEEKNTILSGKEKFKQRKELKISKHASKSKNDGQHMYDFDDDNDCLLLVNMIVQALVDEFPDLEEVNSLPNRSRDAARTVGTTLHTFCLQAFVSDKLKMSINRIVRQELEKNMKLFRSSSLTHGNTSYSIQAIGPHLNDMHEIQQAFEDPSCFPTSCFMIQSAYKVLLYAKEILSSNSSDPILYARDVENLEKEFLTGCCADFTRRLTQYSLQKNNVDDETSIMIRQSKTDELVGQEIPYYYDSVNIATTRYKKVYLCTVNNTNPLTTLRDSLPRSIGVSLARQWMLCGGECYQGGVTENEIGPVSRPGDCDAFMQHVYENCLSICGIPFTKLEKKAEKKFLADRKQLLIRCIEEIKEDEPVALYELTIMLLYQAVKNMIVFGSHLKGPILQMLLKERKVTDDVREDLLKYGQKLCDGEAIDNDMIDNMKRIALGKDGTKKK